MMEDFPAKIADLLETTTTRIREITVDRIARWIKWTAAGIVIGLLATILVVFLLVGSFRLLGELIGVEWAYVLLGGLFLLVGLLLLNGRTTSNHPKED
jgi:hypothetical protein